VLHIGANVGEEANIYSEMGINNVLWIEGNADLIPALNANISRYIGQKSLCALIGDVDGEKVNFNISSNGGQSSSVLALGTHKDQHPDVTFVKFVPGVTRRIDCLLIEEEIKNYDFLNVDLQGYDLNAIKGMGDYLKYFKAANIEVNTTPVYEGCALFPEVIEYMASFGFRLVDSRFLGRYTWGDACFVKE
jgi:FkbM family methyltransferase